MYTENYIKKGLKNRGTEVNKNLPERAELSQAGAVPRAHSFAQKVQRRNGNRRSFRHGLITGMKSSTSSPSAVT